MPWQQHRSTARTKAITVRLGEPLWRTVGRRRLHLSVPADASVHDVLEILRAHYPSLTVLFTDEGRRRYRLFVNAVLVAWEGAAHRSVQDGDTLYIFPPAVGGREEWPPLERAFFARDTVAVARALLGCYLVREYAGNLLVGRIIETEAYVGPEDKASHAAVGRTDRNAVMFGPPGHAYVYLIYGMHHCLNVVTEAAGYPAAVLIRALEPIAGVEIMRNHRQGRPLEELTNGPAKVCQAFAIDRRLNGHDLCQGHVLWIAPGPSVPSEAIATGPRVGVRGDERAVTIPWRFALRGHRGVSRPYPWSSSRRNGSRARSGATTSPHNPSLPSSSSPESP